MLIYEAPFIPFFICFVFNIYITVYPYLFFFFFFLLHLVFSLHFLLLSSDPLLLVPLSPVFRLLLLNSGLNIYLKYNTSISTVHSSQHSWSEKSFSVKNPTIINFFWSICFFILRETEIREFVKLKHYPR